MRKYWDRMVIRFGLPRIIIVGFFLLLAIGANYFQMDLLQLLSDCVRRWGMYGILTLAMVPAVQCGIGLNFGISMGIVGGLLGGLLVIELRLTQIPPADGCSPSAGPVGRYLDCHCCGRNSCGGDWMAVWTAAEPGQGS